MNKFLRKYYVRRLSNRARFIVILLGSALTIPPVFIYADYQRFHTSLSLDVARLQAATVLLEHNAQVIGCERSLTELSTLKPITGAGHHLKSLSYLKIGASGCLTADQAHALHNEARLGLTEFRENASLFNYEVYQERATGVLIENSFDDLLMPATRKFM